MFLKFRYLENTTMKRSLKTIQLLMALVLIASLLAPAALAIRPFGVVKIQPALAALVAQAPDQLVRVIIQKADQNDQAEQLVLRYGGEVVKELALINAFAAQLPARAVPRLATDASVNWVYLDAPVRSASLITETVRDNFDVRAYNNNDGTQPWAGSWTELNDDGQPDGGKIKIDKDVLKLEDKSKGIQRNADLSLAETAVLSFDYRRDKLDKPSKYITLDISSDGGATWSELYRFENGKDSDPRPFSMDLTPYAGANITLRFLTSPDDAGKLYVDNFQIEYTYDDGVVEGGGGEGDGDGGGGDMGPVYTVRDEFSTGDFSGSDGMHDWAGVWIEDDPADLEQNPASGYVQITNGELRINNQNYDNTQPGVTRAVDLSRTTSATLSFDYRTAYGVDISDGISVEVSPDGGASWILLDTIENLSGITSGAKSYDITPFATLYTLVRIRVAYFYGLDNEYFYVDNLEVAYTYDGEVPMRANLQTVGDDFETYPYTYGTNSGSQNWLDDWQEINDDGAPLTGDVHMTNYEQGRRFTFWTDAGVPWEPVRGIMRSADLSGAGWAEVSFLYSRGSMDVGDFLYVEASTDGGATWTEVGHIEGKGTQAIAGSDQGWMYAGFDLSDFITSNTFIRLITNFSPNDYYDNIYLDDVQIAFDKPTGVLPPNYYLETLNVQPVWDMGIDGSGVTVAIVDSGVALDYDFSSTYGEPDTGRLMLQLGFNQNSSIVHDAYGHGTHVAGIIAGNGNGASWLLSGHRPRSEPDRPEGKRRLRHGLRVGHRRRLAVDHGSQGRIQYPGGQPVHQLHGGGVIPRKRTGCGRRNFMAQRRGCGGIIRQ